MEDTNDTQMTSAEESGNTEEQRENISRPLPVPQVDASQSQATSTIPPLPPTIPHLIPIPQVGPRWDKIIKLTKFSGTSRRAEELQEWVEDMEQYGQCLRLGERDILRVASFYLTGAARTWWRTLNEEQKPTTWTAFVALLRIQFLPTNYQQALRDRLRSCRQRTSVAEFVDRFRRLRVEIGDVAESEALDRFVDGLKAKVKQQVKIHDIHTVDEAYVLADRVDRSLFSSTFSSSSFSHPSKSTTVPARSGDFTIPMEVDVIEGEEKEEEGNLNVIENRRPPFKNPPPRKRTLTCWTCGKVGHPYRLCRSGLPPMGKRPPPRRPLSNVIEGEEERGNEEA